MTTSKKLFNRNFLLLWQGQFVSMLGSQAFAVAMMFWLKHETGSASLMGLIMMVSMLPMVLLGPIAGTVADRVSRRKILIVSDVINGVAVLSLAAAISFLRVAPETAVVMLFIVGLISGTLSSFFDPAITAAIPDLVPKDKVAKANSIAESTQQLSQFIGQALGGFLFLKLGAPILFLIDGISYLLSAVSEAFIKIPQTLPKNGETWQNKLKEFKADIVSGIRYAWQIPGLRALFITASIINFFAIPLIVLLPFYVEDVLGVTPDWYGYILAIFGFGALIGYVISGSIKIPTARRATVMLTSLILLAACLPLFSILRNVWLVLGLMAFMGVLNGFFNINIITVLQTTTPSEMRGRMFGLLMTLTSGLTPFAMGLSGIVADLVNRNIPLIYAASGLITLGLTIVTAMNRNLRIFLSKESDV